MFSYEIEKNLHLKILTLQDAEELYELTINSMEHLKEWLPLIAYNQKLEDTEKFIKSTMNQFAENNGFQAGIWSNSKLVGVIGFHSINWINKSTSIGYWLGKGFEGSGIMTKACHAFVHHALTDLKLNRVEIRAAVENTKSRAIPERLGFIKEGCIRKAEWIYDHYVDHYVYGMLAEDWAIKNKPILKC
ncbi:GNAT family N-acetyltransferase [Bacillus sp. AFS041924]|uniref:GNAT family N-acetyltransferase n=1 Tax=Bacillus sp. AFS041924 TaxID=2033503 RepID=UPI000BFD8145|nr:GNAT family protein [Bacillus sp. AFS041924]PGS56811.1 RimJ/RimL family protein N-acetyltransferase [Bacillus sp. AFS041924]